MRTDVTPARIKAARFLAAGTDLLQIVLLPAFLPAVASPVNDVIDVAVALALLRLVGWHWSFLPSFVVELIPIVDLVPTWTAAVFLATRGGAVPLPPTVAVTAPSSPAEAPRALPPGAQPPTDRAGS